MKILAVCSTGLGSSFMTHMNIDKALKELGVRGIDVDHADLGSVGPSDADVVFVGKDIAEAAQHLGDVVVLDSLIDMNEIRSKTAEALTRHGVEVGA
ncbi:PTS sugar transporter subunit IIB [Curtobacterium sp. ME26]|uniref:PTS sugar transporter subunit IIB n=1 Tax=Curtobacterium sp. ME26 TaxID=2744254 RepID=UPI0015F52366|nr:PTS sugar transporter subunit IIB [Curtobacterium sp. ME26]